MCHCVGFFFAAKSTTTQVPGQHVLQIRKEASERALCAATLFAPDLSLPHWACFDLENVNAPIKMLTTGNSGSGRGVGSREASPSCAKEMMAWREGRRSTRAWWQVSKEAEKLGSCTTFLLPLLGTSRPIPPTHQPQRWGLFYFLGYF